jgi:uncharacterized oxidoreductase
MASALTVLITGGSFGLGRTMAQHFVDRGDNVWVCGRSQANLDETVAEIPAVRAVQADVSSAPDRQRLMAAVTAEGRFDILINNAAIAHAHDYTNGFTLGTDRAAEEIAVNFAAPVELSRLFLAWRRSAGAEADPATIVMISTPGALFPLDANPLYTSTKAGLHSFTLSLRYQLRDTPVSVVEVFPPALATGLGRELDVPAEDANGPDAIDAVAAASVAGIVAGERTVLPHPQSVQLYEAFGKEFSDRFLDRINSGVGRRAGWDQE